ncbi:unnamed protein product [Urochloa decumbens]|uniref:Meiosis 5 n=1 Tax=Urochloa decumbens TaxID=240449 RepID=A0ABC8ZG26_9POAL
MARALLASFVLAALAAQAFVGVVESSRTSPMDKATSGQDDVKKPDCVPGVDPHSFPGIGGHGGGITPVPSHGGGGITPVPSHGGGGYVPTPSHGGSGGDLPSPSHGGALPTPAHGGTGGGGLPSPGHGDSGSSPTSPSTGGGGAYGGGSPSHGGSGSSPSTGGGAYGGSPSTPGGGAYGGGSSPSPSHDGGAYGGGSTSPSTPAYGDSPSHGGVGTSSPTPFVPVDPHSLGSLPGSCLLEVPPDGDLVGAGRRAVPDELVDGSFFGSGAGSLGGGAGGMSMSIQDALANTRSDGTGALLREGAAALLNSMTRSGFPYTTDQVRDAFAAAATAGSDGAAAAQAAAFKKANEGNKA